MRLISFVQVLLLLAILAYLILFTLENPALVRLPLPFGRGELSLSVGVTVALFTLIGAAYAALLLLPPLGWERLRRRRERRERRAVEDRLTATLQARLGAVAAAPVSRAPEPARTDAALPARLTAPQDAPPYAPSTPSPGAGPA